MMLTAGAPSTPSPGTVLIDIELSLSEPGESVGSLDFELYFDDSALSYAGFGNGSLNPAWFIIDNPGAGAVSLNMFALDPTDVIGGPASGSVASLEFSGRSVGAFSPFVRVTGASDRDANPITAEFNPIPSPPSLALVLLGLAPIVRERMSQSVRAG
ncbi:MAG: hypothetical protein ACU85V_18760 [Gammaproteobacteria bacterium]